MALSNIADLDSIEIDKKLLIDLLVTLYSDEPELITLLNFDTETMSTSEFVFKLNTLTRKIVSNVELFLGIKSTILKGYNLDNTIINPVEADFEVYTANMLKDVYDNMGLIYIVESRYSILAGLLYKVNAVFDKIRSFDPKETNITISEIINNTYVKNNWNFKAIKSFTFDVNTKQHTWTAWSNTHQRLTAPIVETPDTIINIHCDTTVNFKKWYNSIPNNKKVVMMGSNTKPVYMNKVLVYDKLESDNQSRWLKIGYK